MLPSKVKDAGGKVIPPESGQIESKLSRHSSAAPMKLIELARNHLRRLLICNQENRNARQGKILAISKAQGNTQPTLNLSMRSLGVQSNPDIVIFDRLSDIPHFNPDLDTEIPPPAVADFRNQIKKAEGILICTPEYAMGVPGTLKNAIDWTVSTIEFSHKPVTLITASSSGQKGHQSLLDTLKVIECDIPESSQLLISFVKTKIKNGKLWMPEL
jgi:hypothetical protein